MVDWKVLKQTVAVYGIKSQYINSENPNYACHTKIEMYSKDTTVLIDLLLQLVSSVLLYY